MQSSVINKSNDLTQDPPETSVTKINKETSASIPIFKGASLFRVNYGGDGYF